MNVSFFKIKKHAIKLFAFVMGVGLAIIGSQYLESVPTPPAMLYVVGVALAMYSFFSLVLDYGNWSILRDRDKRWKRWGLKS